MNSVIKQHPLYKLSKISIIELIMSEYVHCDDIPTPQLDNEYENKYLLLQKEFQECKDRSVKQRADIVSLTEKLTNVRSQLSASVSNGNSMLPEGAFKIEIDTGDNVEPDDENNFNPNPTQTEEIDSLTKTNLELYAKIDEMNLTQEQEIKLSDDTYDKLWNENDEHKGQIENLKQQLFVARKADSHGMEKLQTQNIKYKKMLCLLNELLLETSN